MLLRRGRKSQQCPGISLAVGRKMAEVGPALLVSEPALMIKWRSLEQSESRATACGGGMAEVVWAWTWCG